MYPEQLEALGRWLSCPDDGTPLGWRLSALECPACGRDYQARDNVLDLTPRSPVPLEPGSVSREYADYYRVEYGREAASAEPVAWGAPESLPPHALRHKLRQVAQVLKILAGPSPVPDAVFCDVTGAAGHYTFAASGLFPWVLHCDLCPGALRYASEKASKLGLRNIFFLRVDYFQLPFRASLDRMICMDTLIRGRTHEISLLRNIHGSLAPGGRALVDFHNWWHNPLRRIGLLSDNFRGNASYSARQCRELLHQAGMEEYRYFPFRQERDEETSGSGLVARSARLIPPTRLMYLVSSKASSQGGVTALPAAAGGGL